MACNPQHPVRAAVLAIVIAFTVSSPGCGCPRNEPPGEPPEVAEKPEQEKDPVPQQTENKSDSEGPSETPAAEKSTDAGEPPAATSEQSPAGPPTSNESDEKAQEEDNRASAEKSAGSTTSKPTGKKGQPSKASKSNVNPTAARQKASKLAQAARKAAADQDYAEAFREARAAWEAVAPCTGDRQCQALAESLLKEMSEYAVKSNTATGTPPTGKTLVVE